MGLDLFLCEKRKLTLSTAGCSRLYNAASGPKPPDPWLGMAGCRFCPIGSQNATGRPQNPISVLTEMMRSLCVRCGRPSDRLIWNLLCASCDARQKEAIKGKNAKGNPPALSAQLHTERIAFVHGVRTTVIQRPAVASLSEVILHLSKSAIAPAAFGPRRVQWPALVRSSRWQPWSAQQEMALYGSTGFGFPAEMVPDRSRMPGLSRENPGIKRGIHVLGLRGGGEPQAQRDLWLWDEAGQARPPADDEGSVSLRPKPRARPSKPGADCHSVRRQQGARTA